MVISEKHFTQSLEVRYPSLHRFERVLEQCISEGASEELSPTALIDQAVSRIRPYAERNPDLVNHLTEISLDAGIWRKRLASLKNQKGEPYLSDHHLQLIEEVVAPLHDILKFIDERGVQKTSDHQLFIAYVIQKHFAQLGYTDSDVEFMVSVIGDHENLGHEEGRDNFASSTKADERGKALFFILDTLTGVVETGDNTLTINIAQLEKRFTDLYFRHIDPEAGKIYRPIWGLYTLNDFIAFFRELENVYGVKLETGFIETIGQKGAIAAIDLALSVNAKRAPTDPKRLSETQIEELTKIKNEIMLKICPE